MWLIGTILAGFSRKAFYQEDRTQIQMVQAFPGGPPLSFRMYSSVVHLHCRVFLPAFCPPHRTHISDAGCECQINVCLPRPLLQ